MIFLLSINFLTCFELYSTPKLSKYVTLSHSHIKLFNESLLIHTFQDLLHMPHPFILCELFLE